MNLRSGQQGIFPSAYAVDMDYSDFDPSAPKVKRERYLLGYLGSVETRCHKGNAVVCQAVKKIIGTTGVPKLKPHSCILEVSDQGLRMVDRRKPSVSSLYLDRNLGYLTTLSQLHRLYSGELIMHNLERNGHHLLQVLSQME